MRNKILFIAIILLAVSVRLYKIKNPVADWHSFRQADTASVTREFVKHGIDLLTPTYHDLSNIQSGKDNLKGYRMVEFPIINGLTAFLIKTFNLVPQEVLVGRLVSVAFSIITLLTLFFLGRLLSSPLTGLVAAFTFAVLPFSVYYSRVILPEPALLAFSTLSLLLFAYYLKSKNFIVFTFSLITFALSLLVKPYALFLIPVYFSLIWWSQNYFALLTLVPFILLSVAPLYFWREHIKLYPDGVPASDWLYNKDNIRLKGAFFHWLFEVRLGNLILGIGGLVPFVLGFFKKGRDSFVYLVWGFCLLAYLIIFAGGNVQHDYYQVFLLPYLCLMIGQGISFLKKLVPEFISPFAFYLLPFTLLFFSLFVGWYTIRGYYQVNNWPIVEAGTKTDELVPSDAKVIAPYFGDTAFLFQTNRTGWPIGYDIDQKMKLGATHYVSVVYDDEAHVLENKYVTLFKNNNFILLDLTKNK